MYQSIVGYISVTYRQFTLPLEFPLALYTREVDTTEKDLKESVASEVS